MKRSSFLMSQEMNALKEAMPVIHAAVDSMIKAKAPTYYPLYEEQMAKLGDSNKAKSVVGKIFLYHFWLMTRKADGLPCELSQAERDEIINIAGEKYLTPPFLSDAPGREGG